jgi:hypothetical protein
MDERDDDVSEEEWPDALLDRSKGLIGPRASGRGAAPPVPAFLLEEQEDDPAAGEDRAAGTKDIDDSPGSHPA